MPQVQPEMQVTSFDGQSAQLFGLRAERYNPDMLAARKGGLSIYRKMRVDEQVKAVLKFKRDAIIGRGHEFVFDGTALSQEEQTARKRVMKETTRQLDGSFADALTGILTGMDFGFSLTEFVTQTIQVDGASYVGLAKLLTRDVRDFKFYTDDYGALTRFTQQVTSREIDLDYSRFIHYVQNPHEDPYYGRSELEAAYRPWFLKDLDLKFWAAFKERMAGGFLAINLGASGISSNSPDYANLQDLLKNMRSAMGVILPNGVTAELHMPSSTDAYEKAVQFHDLAIAKALLIPNLLGLSHTGQTGSYSQSQTQIEAFFMTLATDTQRLEQCINAQLFKPLAMQNWDDGEFPRFRFKKSSEAHLTFLISSFKDLASASALIVTEKDEAHLRELLDFPEREEGDEALQKIKQDMVPIQEDPNKIAAIEAKVDAAPATDDPKFMTADDVKVLVADAVKASAQPAPAVIEPKPDDAKRFSLDSALVRVDFAYIAQRALALEADIAETVATASARGLAELLSTEKLAGFIAEPDTIQHAELSGVAIGKLKGAFRSGLERAWSTGLNQAMTEVAKARKQSFSQDDRRLHFKSLRDNAADFFDANSFRMAGNLTDAMRATIQQELLQAVKTGLRPEVAAARIYDRLIRKGFTTLNATRANETREDILQALEQLLADALDTANVAAYINTLARTNTFEAMNEARYAEFTDPALGDFVVALRYTAILDDRTTDICRELDGHVHVTQSAVWDTYRPPNHYNCRSLVFAVTALDNWDGVESPVPTVEPQEGFK